MSDLSFAEHLEYILDRIEGLAAVSVGLVRGVNQLIVKYFGDTGLLAAYVSLVVIVSLLVSRILSLVIAGLKYLVLPAVILAVLGTMFLPYSFAVLLPITTIGCSVLLLVKA